MIVRLGLVVAASLAAYTVRQVSVKAPKARRNSAENGAGENEEQEKEKLEYANDGNKAEEEEEEVKLISGEINPRISSTFAIGEDEFAELFSGQIEFPLPDDTFDAERSSKADRQRVYDEEMANNASELERLRSLVKELEEREVRLEGELLEYYGMKEQESDIMELQRQLKIKTVEIDMLKVTINSLQAERKKLQEELEVGKPPIPKPTNQTNKKKKEDNNNNKKTTTTKKTANDGRRLSNAERSAFFGRREAAKILKTVLQGDARKRAVASIKSLVYSPSVRNKKATYALVCQTLKYLPIIKDVLDTAGVLNSKWKRQEELIYVVAYDILFGKEISSDGAAEKFLFLRKDALQSALAKILVRMKVKRVEDLLAQYQTHDVSKPRYVRVNTLKLDVESAVHEFGKQQMVQRDVLVPDLMILPPGTDLHNHPLVMNGSVFLQGRASSMVAAALMPQPGWEVLDACAAPGNKTVHLAAFMRGKGKIVACELNKERVKLLQNTISLAGATNVKVQHEDFLNISPDDPAYSKLRAILLDPSCSGSGTSAERLDHLLPTSMNNQAGDADVSRLTKLATFQKKALEHALSFPSVERIVYSTCSIHQIENEDVIKSVLPMALRNGFQLESPFPQWNRRGLPVFEGSEKALRMDPIEDKEGFFIALFVRKGNEDELQPHSSKTKQNSHKTRTPKKQELVVPYTRMSKMRLYCLMLSQRSRIQKDQ